MHKTNVNKQSVRRVEKRDQNLNGWDWAITDAKNRIKQMRASIRVFEQMRDSGEPWRGSTSLSDERR